MGTRSITFVEDEQGRKILCLYRQYDGYPEVAGADVAGFLANKKIVNGYSLEDTENQFNGAGDLAVRLITFLKNSNSREFDLDKSEWHDIPGHDSIGGFYIQPLTENFDPKNAWVEYIYTVKVQVDTPEATIEFWNLNDDTKETSAASVFAAKWREADGD